MAAIQLLPKIENVFADNFELNAKHFMPIVTIDLSTIDQSLKGEIHVVYFNNDPYCKETAQFFNEFCNDFKVSFDILNGRYRFKTDFGYFHTNDDWIEWIEKGRSSYKESIEKFKNNMQFKISELIKNIGGQPNWLQQEEWPINEQGEKLKFICQVWSGDFVQDYCEEEIFLFYDQRNQMAVQIHQID